MKIKDRLVTLKVRRGFKLHADSIKRNGIRRFSEMKPSVETYNCRLLTYPDGQHVTVYDNPIAVSRKNENFNKAYHNENRERDAETHCRDVSLSRTKNMIYNIARSNEWEWFITLTFDRTKTDSSDYDAVVRKLSKYLNNLQQRKCPGLKYLIVPELHADREHYHFHGLLADCPELEFVFSGHWDKTSNRAIFNIPSWSWGFTTATAVGDSMKASGYITKYITKESEVFLKNKKRYYTNRNTKRTVAEKLNIDKADFFEMYADDITYMKEVTVREIGQHVTYVEMPYGKGETENEGNQKGDIQACQ